MQYVLRGFNEIPYCEPGSLWYFALEMVGNG